MAAEIGTSSNLDAGVRELSLVTNTYAGHFESAGVAYDLVLPWAPDKLEIFNYTKYETDSQTLQTVWFRDMPDNKALVIDRGTTTLTSTIDAAGVLINNSASGFADEHVTITGVSTASPGVVTAAAHGLVAGDRCYITKLAGAVGDELNNKEYVAQNVTTNTFELFDIFGVAVAVVGTWTSGGQVNKEKALDGVVNAEPVYRLTLGTGVVGNDGDEMYFIAHKFNSYFDLGDIA